MDPLSPHRDQAVQEQVLTAQNLHVPQMLLWAHLISQIPRKVGRSVRDSWEDDQRHQTLQTQGCVILQSRDECPYLLPKKPHLYPPISSLAFPLVEVLGDGQREHYTSPQD